MSHAIPKQEKEKKLNKKKKKELFVVSREHVFVQLQKKACYD
jgi:hypothetical protein